MSVENAEAEGKRLENERFVAAAMARLDEAFEAQELRYVRAALRPKTVRVRTLVWSVVAAAAVAALATWGALSVGASERPMAFGDAVEMVATGEITRDGRGRIARVDGPDGERLIFRGGRLVRVERHREGVLDGVSVDFDARGFVAAIRSWRMGVERGPWVELDESGRVHASGER
jgi:hypothetical protein